MKSQRIHHAERVKAKRRKQQPQNRYFQLSTYCSCWMCGNPRKWFGERTIQERKAMQRGALEC